MKKKWIIIANVIIVAFYITYVDKRYFEDIFTNVFIRDCFFMPNICLNRLPENIRFLYRAQNNDSLLVFSLHQASVYEYYVFEYNRSFLEIMNFEKSSINDNNFKITPLPNNNAKRWCKNKNEKEICFRSTEKNTNTEYFASRLDSVGAFLKCLIEK